MDHIEVEHTQVPKSQQAQKRAVSRKNILKKLDQETAKVLSQIKEKTNKKSFGRKVRDWEILAVAVKQITNEHIKELQELTYSEKDRLHLAHEEYVKIHGKISLDQFIGKLMRGAAL